MTNELLPWEGRGPGLIPADFETDLFDDEPRIPDWKLARALGFNKPADIHELIERHRASLERFGNFPYGTENSPGAGRPGRVYRLNFNQAIFVAIKSEAPNAVAVQIHVVTIYGLWAQGKLKPVDAETAATIADATEKVYQAAPELIEMLQGLLTSVAGLATHGDATDIGERLASVQRTGYEIQIRLGDIVKRRPAPVRNQDIYDRVIVDFYMGLCPVDQRHMIIRDGERTRLYTLDHVTDNPYKNALHEMWPVCRYCNSKFKHDPRYRAETMNQFRVFQTRVAEIIGQRLI